MKKLATIVLFGLLFAVPFVTMAAYVDVNYDLYIEPRTGESLAYGYYYMLLDTSFCDQFDFAGVMDNGANLDTINRSAILREGVTTTANVQFNQSTPVGASSVYFAVFNTAQFNNDAFDYWYALSPLMTIENSTTDQYPYAYETSYTDIDGTVNYTIPEPTSGLLVLVGASLLALKRRRA